MGKDAEQVAVPPQGDWEASGYPGSVKRGIAALTLFWLLQALSGFIALAFAFCSPDIVRPHASLPFLRTMGERFALILWKP